MLGTHKAMSVFKFQVPREHAGRRVTGRAPPPGSQEAWGGLTGVGSEAAKVQEGRQSSCLREIKLRAGRVAGGPGG